MTMDGPDNPRRYIRSNGYSVLIGLTFNETAEFEQIDAIVVPLHARGGQAINQLPATLSERRWLELYRKHEDAWSVWKRVQLDTAQ
jgi:hypothetical protein